MSHIETAKTNLRLTSLAEALRQNDPTLLAANPCLALLRQAVTLVANAHQGNIQETYLDYGWEPQEVNTKLALHIPNVLPRGIGLQINVETGELLFQGDPWRVNKTWYASLQQKIIQNYVVLAHCAALRRMKAQVSTQAVDNQVVITGVLHG